MDVSLTGFRGRMEKDESDLRERYVVFSEFDARDVYRAVNRLPIDDRALFLYLAPEATSAGVLSLMNPVEQLRTSQILATLRFSPEYGKRVYEELADRLSHVSEVDVDGAEKLKAILLQTPKDVARALIETIEEENPALANKIKLEEDEDG